VPGQDEAAFLAVNARAFAWHPEQGRLDLPGLQAEMTEDWFDPAGFFLAVRSDDSSPTGDRVLGFHWTKTHSADSTPGPSGRRGPLGEVYVLGVDPEAGVRGLGGPLTAIGLDHLGKLGLDTVMLFVEGDNTRAVKLYERFGFSVFLTNVVYAHRAQTAQ
jgi:mycothiol synthase